MKKQELRKYLQKEIISILKEQEVKNSPIQELEDQIVSFIEEYQQEYDVMEELSELLLSTHNQINREILDEAPKEIVSTLKENEDSPKVKVGSTVTIPRDLTTDPINMQGKSGTVGYINHNTVVVDFPNGVIGLYDINIFNNLNENNTDNGELKKLVVYRLAQFFRVNPYNLSKFKFDGNDNIEEFAKAVNTTNLEGAKAYYDIAINSAKKELGILDDSLDEIKSSKGLDKNWILEKLKGDIKQNFYNLKKMGLEKSILWDKLEELEEALDDYYDGVNEATEEEVENQKELNKELEKTRDIKKNMNKDVNEGSQDSKLRELINDKFRQWRMDAGGMSVMIDDMPEEVLRKVYKQFEKEAKKELGLNEVKDDDEFDIEDKEPTSKDINKNDSISKLGNKLANVTKEMKELVKKWKEASDKDKPKIVGKLKELTKVKKELEKFLDLDDNNED